MGSTEYIERCWFCGRGWAGRQSGWLKEILRKKKEDKTGILEEGTHTLRLESPEEDNN